ncbi:MAG: thioesterase superfamily [uncultured Rubrobacteraceae bacterium]|uniref:Thioesterase superfamily n=1 Tax=uncultured Rubrobacteraceae bacterium TaxID=349277 RepID=A0A6J4R2H0_9ACTN|nr:MAG: thioesterase superfamily [uncultured Rubrobacteraceae bacterium]
MKNPPVVANIQVRYQDLDPYGHVNNALHMSYFETARIAYFEALAREAGIGALEAGDLPGVRYVIAEATVRYKAPIFIDEGLFGAASIRTISNRSFVMDYELRAGESFEEGRLVTEGTSAQVFYDIAANEVRPRPDWFLSTVAALEDRPEESFAKEGR